MHKDERGTGVSQTFGEDTAHAASNHTIQPLAPAVGQNCNAEKRSSMRRRVLKGAEIAQERIAQNIPCQVKNISETGLLIQVDEQYQVPERFKLIIPMDGYSIPCEIVRVEGGKIGVRFIGEKSELGTVERKLDQPTITPILDTFRRRQQELARQKSDNNQPTHKNSALISQFRSDFANKDT